MMGLCQKWRKLDLRQEFRQNSTCAHEVPLNGYGPPVAVHTGYTWLHQGNLPESDFFTVITVKAGLVFSALFLILKHKTSPRVAVLASFNLES